MTQLYCAPPLVKLPDVMSRSLQQWNTELEAMDTDKVMADGSINKLIYMKLKEVFSALLDAATLAGSWIVVDRTNGQGSATAELLLELALERGAQRPTIVAIDSLERLGSAREGTRSHAMLMQLNATFLDEDNASQTKWDRVELPVDFKYSLDQFVIQVSTLPFQTRGFLRGD